MAAYPGKTRPSPCGPQRGRFETARTSEAAPRSDAGLRAPDVASPLRSLGRHETHDDAAEGHVARELPTHEFPCARARLRLLCIAEYFMNGGNDDRCACA